MIWFSDFTIWVGSITVLPGEHGVRATAKSFLKRVTESARIATSKFTPPGIFGDVPKGVVKSGNSSSSEEHHNRLMDRLAERLEQHMEKEELEEAQKAENEGDSLRRDIHFYHYVLSRECRNLQKDLSSSPPKKYTWQDWEYYLKLMGNDDIADDQGDGSGKDEGLVPQILRPTPRSTGFDGIVDRETERREWEEAHERNKKHRKAGKKRRPTALDLQDWSWLSNQSPLMGTKSEAEWILERLSTALERELNRQRKGLERKPPVGMADMKRTVRTKEEKKQEADEEATRLA